MAKHPSTNKKVSHLVKIGQAAQILGVSIKTLRRWEASGKLKSIRTPGGTRYYDPVSLGENEEPLQKKVTFKKSFTTFTLLITLIVTFSVVPQSNIFQKAFSFLQKPSSKIETRDSNILAETTAAKFLEINAPVQVNDTLDVKDAINGLIINASPSASTFSLTSGNTTLNVTNNSTINQNLSTTSSPTFSTLNLSSTSKQIVFQSGSAGSTGTLTWTPTSARTITLPDKTGEVSLLGQTISNSELDNSKVTVSSGTNLTGGGDVSLGSSITLSLKDSISLSGTLAVTGTSTLTGAATLASTLAVTGATTLSSTSLSIGGVSYTFPSSQGAASTVLTDDGAGALSWGTLSSAAGWTDDGSVVRLTTITDNVGIGTTTANSTLSLAGNAHIGGIRQGISAPANGLFVDGNVGIGATTSSNNLDVWGSARITGSLTLDGSCTGCGGITGGANGQVTFYTGATSSSGSNALFWNNILMRLGIGSSAPGSTLGVFGNMGIGSSYGYYTTPVNGLAVEGNIGVGTTTANSTLSVVGNAHIGGIRQGISAPANGLFVDGNVGIGATTSTNLLDVWGSTRITGNLTLDGSCTGCGGLSGGSNGAVTYWSGTNTVAANTAFFWNNPLNRLGIGSSAPGTTLGVFGSVGIGASYGYGILPSNLNNGLAVEGNVGVGKSTTSFNLDVAGSAGIGTSLTVTSLTNTTGLNVSGTSVLGTGYASTLTVSGNTGVGGSLTTTSLDYASGGLRVNGFSDLTGNLGVGLSLTATGTNAVIAGTNLNITGISNLVGNLGVGTSLSVSGTNGLTNTRNLRVSGTADINTLYVSSCTGCGELSGGADGQVTFYTGATSASGSNALFWNNSLMRLGVGSSAPGSTLGVFGSVGIGASYGYGILPSNLNNGLAIEGNVGIGKSTSLFNLDVAGSVGVGTSLTVTSLTNTTGLNVSGTSVLGSAFASSLTVSGNTGIGASISVTGLTYSLGGLRVNGFSDLTGNLGVGSSAIINGNIYTPLGLKVGGFSDLAGNLGVGGSINVTSANGLINTINLNVSGTSSLGTGFASTLTTTGNLGVGLSLTATGTNAVIAGTNLNITGISNLVGNLGVGTSLTVTATNGLTNTRNLRVSGTADINTLYVSSCTGCGGGVSGSGANGQLTFWTSSSAVSGNNALFWDNPGMRLGIGSSAPGSTLGVFGSVGIGTSYGFATLPANLNNGLAIQGNVGIGYSTAGGALVVNGNIGIGSTSPSAPLTFNSTSQTPAANIVNQVNAISAGTTGSYTTQTYLPQGLYGHSAAVYNGYLFVTGGLNAAGSVTSTVYSAQIKADGTIGAFSTLTYLPDARRMHSTVTYNGYLFVTGGLNAAGSVTSTVYSAQIKADGTIGAFSTLTYLPNSLRNHSSVVYNGYLYVTGGKGTANQSTVYSAPFNSDGTIGAFSTLTYLPQDIRSHSSVAYNGYLLVTGGINNLDANQSTVYSAPFNSNGTIGAFSTLTYLPQIHYSHSAAVYNGYLFVTGGVGPAGARQSTVYSAQVTSSGTLGSFSTLTSLPQGLEQLSSVPYNGYLLVTGGQDAGGSANSTVYSAPLGSSGLAINTHGSFASGNLLDLWNNLSSKFSVDYSGNVISALGSKWMPLSDSTTALNIADSQGTSFVKFDSSTQRVGIGVGTSAPTVTLQVLGNVGIGVTGTYTVPVNGLLVGGSVGIGTTSPHPTYKLDVLGAVRATGGFNGTCRTDGTVTNGPLCNQDVAEIYPASEDVESADLLVIDSNADKSVKKSSFSYDNHIIGIVSSSPGLILGLNGSDVYLGGESSAYSQKEEAKRLPAVALAGKVPVKVSSENGPINVGDYLTSSSTPGVAMKATRPGQVVGKALEAFGQKSEALNTKSETNSNDQNSNFENCDLENCFDIRDSNFEFGKILTFVNISYADPNNFFASLSFDSEGNLVIPKIKVGTLTLDSSIASASASLSVIPADAGIHLTTSSSEMDPRLRGDDGKVFYDLTGKIASLEERISKLEASIPEQPGTTQIASDSATPIASDSADLASNYTLELTPPDTLLASSSASLATPGVGFDSPGVFSDASIGGKLTAYQTEISDYLKVFGETTLAKTNVAGDLTVDGTLSIENGSEINVIGTLFLQKSSLSENINLFAGKVTIDKNGNITTFGEIAAAKITTNKLTITNIPIASASASLLENQIATPASGEARNDNPTIGTAKIPAGQINLSIAASQVTDSSKIFITPRSKIGAQSLVVESVKSGYSFTVSLDHPLPEDMEFDWWIVGTK